MNTEPKPTRIERLISYIDMMHKEESGSGHRQLSADLKALSKALRATKKGLEEASTIPEWGNHQDIRTGEDLPLGTVANAYAIGLEDNNCEDADALQLAEMAKALAPAINALTKLTF